MEQFQNQYAAVSYEYGNPFRSDEYGMRVDQYGNPVCDQYGQHYGSTPTFSDAPVYSTQPRHVDVDLSDDSSEEEDDRYGGQRKKGLREKIKEKIPGMGHKHGHHQSQATSTYTPDGTYSTEPRHQKGIMEKIKEKLPGHHP